jgi:short-subunit dehydrogenase involved in D-alanine esterification of teichoic acids
LQKYGGMWSQVSSHVSQDHQGDHNVCRWSEARSPRTTSLNLLGAIRMTYALLPHLVTKDDAAVMNVTSALAFVPLTVLPGSMSRAARLATRSLLSG